MSSNSEGRGMLGNLVRSRAGSEPNPEIRALMWWLQAASWAPGGIDRVAEEVAKLEGGSVAGGSIAEWVHSDEWLAEAIDRAMRESSGYRTLGDQQAMLAERRLDPRSLGDRLTGICLGDPAAIPTALVNRLSEMKASESITARGFVASTETVRTAWAALDRCAAMGAVVILEGPSRTGKTAASRAWCAASGGAARYVPTPHGNDMDPLFRSIATAIGTAAGLSFKARQVEERILRTLPGSGIVLVFDDAWNLWPQGDTRQSHPRRLQWMLSLIDAGVPIAMVTSPQWWECRRTYVAETRWAVDQLDGRVADVVALPKVLSTGDCEAVAAKMLPGTGPEAWELLGATAQASSRRLGAMEAAVKEAKHLAESEQRPTPSIGDIKKACRIAIKADEKLAAETRTPQPSRKRLAPPFREAPSQSAADGDGADGHGIALRRGIEAPSTDGFRRGNFASGEPQEVFALTGNGGSDIAPPGRERSA